MSTDLSYVDIEVVDHVPTHSRDGHPSPNFERRDSPMEIDNEVNMRSPNKKDLLVENDTFDASDNNKSELNDALSKGNKTCFFLSFSCFVILYLIFFFVIAFTYPLKPELYIQQFYIPAFDQISPNITQEMKESVFFLLRFNNRNELISVSYDDVLNITIYHTPNTTASIYFANTTFPGFYQHNADYVTTDVLQVTVPGISGFLKWREEFGSMIFNVTVEFNMRFHCRELGKQKHRFIMSAAFEFPPGASFLDTLQLY